MPPPRVLVQLDPDPQPSVFDSIVAIDAGVDQLLRHHGVQPAQVRDLVYGALFTRAPKDLQHTAVFVGGANVQRGEELFAAVERTFFGPFRCSVMLDANGANTTAAAAILAVQKHLDLSGVTALVLGGTGPVGQRVARLLARQGAEVRVGSRDIAKSADVCQRLAKQVSGAKLQPVQTASPEALSAALEGAAVVAAAGAPGVVLLPSAARMVSKSLKIAIDLNAVPPYGIEGIDVGDKAADRDGVITYGAIGVGGIKMKIHTRAIQRLFESNDAVLDVEEIHRLGLQLAGRS